MDVILTRSVGIRGVGYEAGTQLTLPDEDAKALIQMGKAEEITVSMETPRDPPPAETPVETVEEILPIEMPVETTEEIPPAETPETAESTDMLEEPPELPVEPEPMDLPERPTAAGRQGTSRSKGSNQRKK